MNEREAYLAGDHLEVGTDPVLLVDDAFIEDRWGVYSHFNRPIKDFANPILRADQPWETSVSSPNVIYDEEHQIFHMWYTVFDTEAYRHQYDWNDWKPEHGHSYAVSYARSVDGVNWEKPRFPGRRCRNFAETNIVATGHQKCQGAWVIRNHPSSGQPGRFLMSYRDSLPGAKMALCLAYSDDGIDWRLDPGNPLMDGVRDTRHNLAYDPLRERWLLYTRPWCLAASSAIPDGPSGNFKRRAAVAVGPTPHSMGFPRCVLWPDDGEWPDYDNFMVSRVGSHFLGLVTHMGPPPEAHTQTHLVTSADGINWQRPAHRSPVIPLGAAGEFDAGQTSSVGPLVHVGEKTLLYYFGTMYGQGARENASGIGMSQIKRDRWIAQMGGVAGGFLLTREIRIAGRELRVNITLADTHNCSQATEHACVGSDVRGTHPELGDRAFAAELVSSPGTDGNPRPIPGFTFADCTAVATDSLDYPLTWNGSADLGKLQGQPVLIRFYLKNTGLYAFRFVE
jgi:hypothetical protein